MSTTDISKESSGIRDQIIHVSRELFDKFGYKKTTMEDIAHALRKGKSSLYYYFKNKEEIFLAVIEGEEQVLLSKLSEVVNNTIDPKQKLESYVMVRMETMAGLGNYASVLKEELTTESEFYRTLFTRKEEKEKEFLIRILEEGVNNEVFQLKNCELAASAIFMALKGLEVPLFKYIDNLEEFKVQISNVLNILFFGLLKR